MFSYLKGREIKQIAFVHLARPLREHLAKTRRLAAKMLPNIHHTFPDDFDEIRF